MALTLEDQIEIFTDPRFNSELAAQHFFASNAENEIMRKLSEMTVIQGSIETVLKQKVRQNYKAFLHANEEIKQVGVEMKDLLKLIDNTEELVQVR